MSKKKRALRIITFIIVAVSTYISHIQNQPMDIFTSIGIAGYFLLNIID